MARRTRSVSFSQPKSFHFRPNSSEHRSPVLSPRLVPRSCLRKTGLLEQFANGELLNRGEDGTLNSKRRLPKLLLVHFAKRKRVAIDLGAEMVASEQCG